MTVTESMFKNNGKPPFTPEKTYPRNRGTPKKPLITPMRKLNIPDASWWNSKSQNAASSPYDTLRKSVEIDRDDPDDGSSIWGGLVSMWRNISSTGQTPSRAGHCGVPVGSRKRSRCMDPYEGTPYEYLEVTSSQLGGKVLLSSDDFFGSASNMLLPDSNKEAQGWCTRRRRVEGHDWCIIKLAAATYIRRVEISTRGYLGDHAPSISVEFTTSVRTGEVEGWILSCLGNEDVDDYQGDRAGRGLYMEKGVGTMNDLDKALHADEIWADLISITPLKPGTESTHQHVFHIEGLAKPVQYLRLNLFPDGGIARFRVFGEVARPVMPLSSGSNYCSLLHGASVILFSSAFFGTPWNLLRPDEPQTSDCAWITARNPRRPAVLKKAGGDLEWGDISYNDNNSNEYVIIQMAHKVQVDIVVISTKGLFGNIADTVLIELTDASRFLGEGASLLRQRLLIGKSDNITWTKVAEPLQLQPDQDLTYRLMVPVEATHLRIRCIPDGAISRIRLYGKSCPGKSNNSKRKKLDEK